MSHSELILRPSERQPEKPRPYGPAAFHARAELDREEVRKETREMFATDAAWALVFPGVPCAEVRAWCELGELAAHWDRILDEAEGGAR